LKSQCLKGLRPLIAPSLIAPPYSPVPLSPEGIFPRHGPAARFPEVFAAVEHFVPVTKTLSPKPCHQNPAVPGAIPIAEYVQYV
jgi:hypothetical protein